VALAVLSFSQAVAAVMGMIAAARIRIHLMMVYYWVTLVILLVMLLFGVTALDFQDAFEVRETGHRVASTVWCVGLRWMSQ
jgi:hypothetical protein